MNEVISLDDDDDERAPGHGAPPASGSRHQSYPRPHREPKRFNLTQHSRYTEGNKLPSSAEHTAARPSRRGQSPPSSYHSRERHHRQPTQHSVPSRHQSRERRDSRNERSNSAPGLPRPTAPYDRPMRSSSTGLYHAPEGSAKGAAKGYGDIYATPCSPRSSRYRSPAPARFGEEPQQQGYRYDQSGVNTQHPRERPVPRDDCQSQDREGACDPYTVKYLKEDQVAQQKDAARPGNELVSQEHRCNLEPNRYGVGRMEVDRTLENKGSGPTDKHDPALYEVGSSAAHGAVEVEHHGRGPQGSPFNDRRRSPPQSVVASDRGRSISPAKRPHSFHDRQVGRYWCHSAPNPAPHIDENEEQKSNLETLRGVNKPPAVQRNTAAPSAVARAVGQQSQGSSLPLVAVPVPTSISLRQGQNSHPADPGDVIRNAPQGQEIIPRSVPLPGNTDLTRVPRKNSAANLGTRHTRHTQRVEGCLDANAFSGSRKRCRSEAVAAPIDLQSEEGSDAGGKDNGAQTLLGRSLGRAKDSPVNRVKDGESSRGVMRKRRRSKGGSESPEDSENVVVLEPEPSAEDLAAKAANQAAVAIHEAEEKAREEEAAEAEATEKKRLSEFWANVGKKHLSRTYDKDRVLKRMARFKGSIAVEHILNIGHLGLTTEALMELSTPMEELACEMSTLGLEYNVIDDLPVDILKDKAHLKVLDMEMNQISHIPESVFLFPNLIQLNLCSNNITEVAPTLYDLGKLTRLVLARNRIKVLPRGISKLKCLRILRVESNELTELPDDLGVENSELISVDISKNKDMCCGLPQSMLGIARQLHHLFYDDTELHNFLPKKVRDLGDSAVIELVAGKTKDVVSEELADKSKRKGKKLASDDDVTHTDDRSSRPILTLPVKNGSGLGVERRQKNVKGKQLSSPSAKPATAAIAVQQLDGE